MTKFVLIFLVFSFGVNIALANDISQFVFTTNVQTTKPTEISEPITIQAQNSNGEAISAGETLCLRTVSTSSTGEFSSNSGEWSSISIFTINSNWKTRTFYYKDSAQGNYLIDAQIAVRPSGTTCQAWPKNEWEIKWSAKQNIVVSADSSSSVSQISSSSVSSSQSSSEASIASGSVAYVSKSEHISAKAGEDKTAIAGADIILEGKAYGFKNEPIANARYFWTLGDGSYKEGQNIRHIYKYPGNYIAVLNASSGDVSASDRLNVKVIPNELQIIETKNEFIKLKNKSSLILDLSGWFLKAGGSIFKFPDYSLISANAELIISSDISSLKFANNDFSAEILYPNGSLAFSYKVSETVLSQSSSAISSAKPKEIITSASSAKKEEVKVKPVEKSQAILNTSAVSSQKFTVENNLPAGVGFTGVVTIGDKGETGNKWWLILAGITGIIGSGGIFLAKKFG